MAYQRLGITDLVMAIQKKVEEKTGLRCYDFVERNTLSPFYFVEVIGTVPENTKTMFCDKFNVYVHCIDAPQNDGAISSVGVYKLIEGLQEALTENVELPESFDLIYQTDNGVQTIKIDETNEKHAVLSFDFKVCYGFRCKI